MKTRIRIQGTLIFLAVVATILLSKFILPHWRKESQDELLDALGLVLILSGFLFRMSARGLKEEGSGQGHKLVKDGPYVVIRNPMYFGTFLIGTGVVFFVFSLWALPIFFAILLTIYIPQIKKEEKALSERFVRQYQDYCKATPAYFPNLRCLKNIRAQIWLKWPWIKKELSSFFWVIIMILTIEVWEDARLFGHNEIFKETLEVLLTILVFSSVIFLLLKKKDL